MNRSTAKFALYGLSALLAVAGVFVALILVTSSGSSDAAGTAERQSAAASSSQAAASADTGSKASSSSSASPAKAAESTAQQSSGGSQGNGTGASSEHVHSWTTSETVRHVSERSHTETVTVPGEDIVEYHTTCDACGAVCDGVDALAEHFQSYPDHAKSGYTTNCPVVTGRTADATETVTVVDEAAHDEVITTRKCSTCGAEEQSVS